MPGVDPLAPDAVAATAARLVRVPSVTGDERAAAEALVACARELGLEARVVEEDLAAARAHRDHPGEEAPRSELVTAEVRRPGAGGRIALCGHLDVVAPGEVPWTHGPWSGRVEEGRLHGRGSADMKGAVAALLHAMAAAPPGPELVLLGVASEEDGGLGAFAALGRDARFDACLIGEPTGFAVCSAQAGALTFIGTVPGVAAHAAVRLEGISAIDRYVAIHAALAALEAERNAAVAHPLMGALPLPYPVAVGRVAGGAWSSSVPDRLEFEGRLGVRVGEDPAAARAALEAAVAEACPEAEVAWTGGQFAAGATDPEHPWVRRVADAVLAERGAAPLCGVPYGADMRLFTTRGIPTVMVGTHGLERAHAVDEWVDVEELAALARIVARALA
jgi:acetylornithine deacetylase